jgi:hypothetical protein
MMNIGSTTQDIIPAEARAMTMQAYIYGEPTADGYRIQHAYFGDRVNSQLKVLRFQT